MKVVVKKKALNFDKDGRTYLYYPVISETDCTYAERKSFLNRVYNGAVSPMLAAFLEDSKLSQDEISELQSLLDKEKGDKK